MAAAAAADCAPCAAPIHQDALALCDAEVAVHFEARLLGEHSAALTKVASGTRRVTLGGAGTGDLASWADAFGTLHVSTAGMSALCAVCGLRLFACMARHGARPWEMVGHGGHDATWCDKKGRDCQGQPTAAAATALLLSVLALQPRSAPGCRCAGQGGVADAWPLVLRAHQASGQVRRLHAQQGS